MSDGLAAPPRWSRRVAPAVVGALGIMAVVMLGADLFGYLNHDSAWYLVAARDLPRTGALYTETFFDPNPPFVLWLSRLIVDMGGAIGIDPAPAFKAGVVLVALSTGALTWRVLGTIDFRERRDRPAAGLAVLVAVLIASAAEFGQREHLVSMLLLPYVMSIWARCRGRDQSSAIGVAVGLAAATALLLKPHYCLVVIGCEAMLALRLRSLLSVLRPSVFAIAAGGVVGVAAVALFAPAYFSELLPILLEVYGAYRESPSALLPADVTLAAVALVAAMVVAASERGDAAADGLSILAVAGVASFLAFAQQGTGWHYQSMPFRVFAITAALIALHRLWAGCRPMAERQRAIAIGVLAMSLVAAAMLKLNRSVEAHHPSSAHSAVVARLVETIDRQPEPVTVGALGTDLWPYFPAVIHSRGRWTMPGPVLWTLPALLNAGEANPLAGRREGSSARDRAAMLGQRAVLTGLTPTLPSILLIQNPPLQGVRDRRIDLLALTLKMPEFQNLEDAYRLHSTQVAGHVAFTVLERRPGAMPSR